jgi:16S rRNA (cytosine1402-N4)-methyltransferase
LTVESHQIILCDEGFFIQGTTVFKVSNVTDITHQHIPVMLQEVLQTLAPQDGGVYIDGTFGAGGYARAILQAAACTVYAIDRDPEAILRAEAMARDFNGRLIPLSGCFGDMQELLAQADVTRVDGIVLDIGVSSIQLSTAARGFSFMHDGPLDMRMSLSGQTARDVVMKAPEKELADIIYMYGEEKASRRIARAIVEARTEQDINTTKDLVKIIHKVLPMHGGLKTDTATRTFQALRIFVNDELGELDRALAASEDLLSDGGRLVVVSFHSLEDWRVKNFFREKSGRAPNASRHLPQADKPTAALFSVEKNSGLKPSDEETARNPRARSARLRYGARIRSAAQGKESRHA